MIKNKYGQEELWITNISSRNVSLRDLALTIPARKSFNLLDKKHFHLTLDQIQQSIESGSIFAKQDKIKVRKVAPVILPPPEIEVSTQFRYCGPPRSLVVIEEKRYEELEISDESLAEEFAAIDTNTIKTGRP